MRRSVADGAAVVERCETDVRPRRRIFDQLVQVVDLVGVYGTFDTAYDSFPIHDDDLFNTEALRDVGLCCVLELWELNLSHRFKGGHLRRVTIIQIQPQHHEIAILVWGDDLLFPERSLRSTKVSRMSHQE